MKSFFHHSRCPLIVACLLAGSMLSPVEAGVATPRHRADPATLKNNNMPSLAGMTEAQALEALSKSTATGHKTKLIACDASRKGKVSLTVPPAGYPIQPDHPTVELIVCKP